MADDERRSLRRYLPWAGVVVLFIIAVETAPEVYDIDAVEGGLLPLIAAAAAAPFGVIATRAAPLGWVVSAGSALLISRTVPVIDDDPWPWPAVHGLVMLAFVVAIAWRPPVDLSRFQQVGTVIVVWLGTATLFGTSAPERLRAGWFVGVTAAALAGVLLSRLGWYGGAPVGGTGRRAHDA